MLESYKDDLDQLAEEGWSWFEEYNNYILSARGVLNFAEQFSGDLIGSAAKTFKDAVEETGAEDHVRDPACDHRLSETGDGGILKRFVS